MSLFSPPLRLSRRAMTLAMAAWAGVAAAADPINWVSLHVYDIQSTGGFGICFATLPDGRFVLGQQKKAFVQNTFGAAPMTQQAANNVAFDPAFVAVQDGTHALLGQGGSFGAVSGLHRFDPATPTGSSGGIRPALATKAQNYVAAYWHSPTSALEGWLIGGANGPSGPFSGHNVIFVSLDGTKTGKVTEELCTYSAGLTTDPAGNLYTALYELDGSPNAADADKVLRFSAAQLEPKIQAIMNGAPAAPLLRSAATFLHKFQGAASIAVDGLGRVWASGFSAPLVEVYDPATDVVRSLVPGHAAIGGGQDTYQVSTFTRTGVPHIGILAYDSWMFSGTPVYYVQAPAADVDLSNTYASWAAEKFGAENLTPGSEATLWGAEADPDADGLLNLSEYAHDMNPLAAQSQAPVTTTTSSSLFTISFLRSPLITDLTYIVEVSSSLALNDWTTIASSTGTNDAMISTGASAVGEAYEGTLKRVTVTDASSALNQTPRFMRLRLELDAP